MKHASLRTLAVTAISTVAMAGAITPAAAAGSGAGANDTEYAITEQVCPPAEPGYATCYAMRRVLVPKGTPGAVPFTPITSVETGPKGGFTPADLLTAYGLDDLPASAGTGQVVAAVDAYNNPNALSDLQAFDAYYGLPSETSDTFQVLNQDGATSPLPANNAGWAGEESLDVDAIRAICHNCKILLVEANSTSFNDLAAAVAAAANAGATEISNSYGGAEGTAAMSTTLKNQLIDWYNWPGVVVTASTGDDGWYGYDMPFAKSAATDNSPSFPATLPDVVSVGGTSLVLNSDATRQTEAVWNENGPETKQYKDIEASYGVPVDGASGGGCSLQFAAPAWQSTMDGYSSTGCGTSRLAADVSALADPYTGFDVYDTYNAPGWSTFGGTSLASPLIAAMWALAGGAQGVSNPALTLYGQAKSGSGAFYDVTKGYEAFAGSGLSPLVLPVGGNDWCSGDPAATCKTNTAALFGGQTIPDTAGGGNVSCVVDSGGAAVSNVHQCTAAVGFDGPSGIGAPAGPAAFTPLKPTASFSAPTGVSPGAATSFSGSATDPFPGGTISSYSWHWDDGTSNSTGANPSHTFASAGTYAVKLTATDNYGQVGTVTHDVTVGATAPAVTSIAPTSGATGGGTSVTIMGSGFAGASAVDFCSDRPAASFTVDSATQITAVTAAHFAGDCDVLVTTPTGTSSAVSADRFTFAKRPAVTSIAPSLGPTGGGTTVTILGTGFTGTTAVNFCKNHPAASFTVNSATKITAVTAPHSAGVCSALVTTPSGTSATVTADEFTYAKRPSVTSVSPSSGSQDGGTTVTILGTGFTGTTAVNFCKNHPATSFTVNSATKITAVTAPHSAGVCHTLVTTPAGTNSGVTADQFTYAKRPSVTSVAPSSGPTAGGTTVTIVGSRFTGATAVNFCKGHPAASFTVISATKITAVTPSHSAGLCHALVTTSAGTSSATSANQFTYTAA